MRGAVAPSRPLCPDLCAYLYVNECTIVLTFTNVLRPQYLRYPQGINVLQLENFCVIWFVFVCESSIFEVSVHRTQIVYNGHKVGSALEMARSSIFQAWTTLVRNIQPSNRPWTDNISSFSNWPVHGPLDNWHSCIFWGKISAMAIFPSEAKYLLTLFCFCGAWLVEVDMSCDIHNKQSYMLGLMCK